MKIQIRQSVFETNSSSTHALSIYDKDKWQEFKDGILLMDTNYSLGNLKKKEDLYEEYLKHEKGPWGSKNPTPEGFEEWLCDNTFDSDSFEENYEVLAEEIPDSNYIAVSIYGYE